jgi:Protein of unknown function (DUF3592)
MFAQILVTIVFLVFGGTLAAVEFQLAKNAVLQVKAESFPTVTGRVLNASVTSRKGTKGHVYYYPKITYSYQVGGKTFHSSRLRYTGSSYGFTEANGMIRGHPAGSQITVYYNLGNPADAVLFVGMDARTVGSLFIMGAILAALPWFAGRILRDFEWPGVKPIAGGQKIIAQTTKTCVRLPRYEAGSAAIITGVIAAFVSVILSSAIPNLSSPSLEAGTFGEIALAIVVALTLLVYGWRRARIASGKEDLIIDEAAGTVELPLTYKRKKRSPLPFSDIQAVVLDKIAHSGRHRTTYTYAPALLLRDGKKERLTDLGKHRAESFAAWLREKLGLPQP